MSHILKAASMAAILLSAAGSFWISDPSFAQATLAQTISPAPLIGQSQIEAPIAPITPSAPLPSQPVRSAPTAPVSTVTTVEAPAVAIIHDRADEQPVAPPVNASSLASLVETTPVTAPNDEENCLAGAVYFESKSESLAGQLAVARVVINRTKSGRFPRTLCGVVYQRSQFSFVRGRAMPAINRAGRQWKNAVAIARIALENRWKSGAEGALFFHAARVSPRWSATRLAQIDNHIFYR